MEGDAQPLHSGVQSQSSGLAGVNASGRKRKAAGDVDDAASAAADLPLFDHEAAAAAVASPSLQSAAATDTLLSHGGDHSSPATGRLMEEDSRPAQGVPHSSLIRLPSRSSARPFLGSASSLGPLLRCIALHRDVQFLLTQMLTLKDLAALNSTCRSWRLWLLHPPLISGLQFDFRKCAKRVILLAQSDWARQLVTTVHMETWIRGDSRFLLEAIGPAESELAACNQLLSALPRFTRLRILSLQLCDAFTETTLWPTCMAALSGSLRKLELDGDQAAPINSALAHVGRLRCLTTLSIFVGSRRLARGLDLAQLPSLRYLRFFELLPRDEHGKEDWFRCTPTQIHSLAQCKKLTRIDSGSIWSPSKRELDDEGRQLPPAAQQIAEGIATLVRGLTLQPPPTDASAGASVSFVAPPTSTPTPCRLRFLKLSGTDLSAAVWEHVWQLNSLTALVPLCWRGDVAPQQWARLVDFKRLEVIRIASHLHDDHSKAPLRTEDFLPHLLQCAQLQVVCIAGPTLTLSAAQLDGIARLPLLRDLLLHSVELESVTPLARAAGLRRLWLAFCRGSPAVVDFRSSLPPLPTLTKLEVRDRCRITADQAAPLNAVLFARMSNLTSANFEQNLLASS